MERDLNNLNRVVGDELVKVGLTGEKFNKAVLEISATSVEAKNVPGGWVIFRAAWVAGLGRVANAHNGLLSQEFTYYADKLTIYRIFDRRFNCDRNPSRRFPANHEECAT